jgi:hypothetical protein
MTEIFPIVPAAAKPIWLLAGICALLFGVALALAYTGYATQNARFEIKDDQLRLVGDFWARQIPLDAIHLDQAAVIDLNESADYVPTRRTLGTSLPGYASGWFRLRNGEKALAYLTRRDAVAYLPTSLGYALLLSADRPHEFLLTLRSRSGRSAPIE